ncbi:PepSY-associated TM helix domain-containing protein [Halomonas sp. AOP35-4E-18]|uniref:PepSY-associated TM helix domain-containing protein n=1 Tax=Halomonas sp. AOP35-4E-18 TaxID=3457686 RepID=UPI004034D7A9
MKSTFRHLLAELHGGTGALFGVLLFVVLFSGSWSLGQNALHMWGRPPVSSMQGQLLPIEHLLAIAGQEGVALDGISLVLPTAGLPEITFCEAHQACQLTLDPFTGQPLMDVPSLNILTELHKNVFIGFPGRVLVSLFGIVLMILCVTGLLLHRRRWRDLWRWRRDRGVRRSVSDLHGLIGIWAFPWLLMFAITGALSGLGALGTLALSSAVYPQEPHQAFADLLGPLPPAASGQSLEQSISLDLILKRDAQHSPGFTAQRLTLNHWGDQAATVDIGGINLGLASTANFESRRYRLSDGALLMERSAADFGPWTRAFIAIQPLHFADYLWLGSGLAAWLSGLHLAMGLSACLLCASGLHLWGQRRKASISKYASILPQLAEGVCGGLVAAAAMLLLSIQATPQALSEEGWPGRIFWITWGTSLLVSLALPQRWRPLPALLAFAGGACLLAAGLHLWGWVAVGRWPPLSTNLTLLLFGVLLCRPTWWLMRPSRVCHPTPHRTGGQNV